MQYSIYINQQTALKYKLSVSESMVFDYLTKSSSWADSIQYEGESWYFVSRNKICKDLPLVTEKPDTMYRHLKSLKTKNLIRLNKLGKKDLILVNKEAARLWLAGISEHSEKFPSEVGKISENDSEKFPTNQSTNTYTKETTLTKDIVDSEKSTLFPENEVEEKKSKKQLEAEQSILYINEMTGSNFQPLRSGKETKSFKLAKRLLKDYTLEEIKLVIEFKCFEWLNDAKMKKHLQPSTLFRLSNFENYIEAAEQAKSNPEFAKRYTESETKPAAGQIDGELTRKAAAGVAEILGYNPNQQNQ